MSEEKETHLAKAYREAPISANRSYFLSKGYEPTERYKRLNDLESRLISSAFFRSAGTGRDEHSAVINDIIKAKEARHQFDNTQGQNNQQYIDTQNFSDDQRSKAENAVSRENALNRAQQTDILNQTHEFQSKEAQEKYKREQEQRDYDEDTKHAGDIARVYDPKAGPLDWAEVAADGDQNKAMNIAFDALSTAAKKTAVNNILDKLTSEGLVSQEEVRKMVSGKSGIEETLKTGLRMLTMRAFGDIRDPSMKAQALNEMKREIFTSAMDDDGKDKLKRLAEAKIPEGAMKRYKEKLDREEVDIK